MMEWINSNDDDELPFCESIDENETIDFSEAELD